MQKYSYKAKKGLNELVEGIVEADGEDEALAQLTARGLFPVSVEEVKIYKAAGIGKPVNKINKRITSGDILNFTQKLSTLIRAKVELLGSLKIIYEQTDNVRLQAVILELYNSTKEGRVFSESLNQFPNIFFPLFVNIVKAGEASGRLDLSLQQINEFLSREEVLKTKVKIALAYPAILLLVGLTSIFVLMNFVIPKLKPIFISLSGELPLVTKIILWTSDFSRKSWWLVLIAAALAACLVYYKRGSLFFTNLLGQIRAQLPILKRMARNQELAHFSRSLGILMKSGVPALRSLEIASLSIGEPKLKEGLQNTCRGVASGQSISKCLQATTNLPSFFTKMIAVGEESGRLVEVLDEITQSYTQQIEADIALISSIIEPILILALGLVLGTIVLSILLPIFQITQMVH
jgi:general secretion pathway protein F